MKGVYIKSALYLAEDGSRTCHHLCDTEAEDRVSQAHQRHEFDKKRNT